MHQKASTSHKYLLLVFPFGSKINFTATQKVGKYKLTAWYQLNIYNYLCKCVLSFLSVRLKSWRVSSEDKIPIKIHNKTDS